MTSKSAVYELCAKAKIDPPTVAQFANHGAEHAPLWVASLVWRGQRYDSAPHSQARQASNDIYDQIHRQLADGRITGRTRLLIYAGDRNDVSTYDLSLQIRNPGTDADNDWMPCMRGSLKTFCDKKHVSTSHSYMLAVLGFLANTNYDVTLDLPKEQLEAFKLCHWM